jgi:hypothetical protein
LATLGCPGNIAKYESWDGSPRRHLHVVQREEMPKSSWTGLNRAHGDCGSLPRRLFDI